MPSHILSALKLLSKRSQTKKRTGQSMTSREQITLNQITYDYLLNKKAIKHMYMRVKDGQVVVNVPRSASIKQVEVFVERHIESILKHSVDSLQAFYSIKDQYFYLLGQRYQLVASLGDHFSYQIKGSTIFLYDKVISELTIYRLMKELSEEKIRPMFDQILLTHSEFKKPRLGFQRMKSKWGVCFPKQNKIKLSTLLIHQHSDLIEYVIYHELVHLFVPNHSAQFYQRLGYYLPNHQDLRKALNKKGEIDE